MQLKRKKVNQNNLNLKANYSLMMKNLMRSHRLRMNITFLTKVPTKLILSSRLTFKSPKYRILNCKMIKSNLS